MTACTETLLLAGFETCTSIICFCTVHSPSSSVEYSYCKPPTAGPKVPWLESSSVWLHVSKLGETACGYVQVAYNPQVLLPASKLGENSEVYVQDAAALAFPGESLTFWQLQVICTTPAWTVFQQQPTSSPAPAAPPFGVQACA